MVFLKYLSCECCYSAAACSDVFFERLTASFQGSSKSRLRVLRFMDTLKPNPALTSKVILVIPWRDEKSNFSSR